MALLLLPFSLRADVLVVVGAHSPSISLSRDQVGNLFLGRIVALPGGGVATPIDQSVSSPLRDEFYLKVTNKSAAQAKAHWAKLYFTGRGVPPREGASSDEVKRLLNSIPGAIGYIDRSALDDSVHVVFVAQ